MKTIEVVAAVIRRDEKILATQRGYGNHKGRWEFPGGKIEQGESHQEALVREIREELSIAITIDRYIATIEYDYPGFHLVMHNYLCHAIEDGMRLNEHMAARWIDSKSAEEIDWLPADILVVDVLRNQKII